LERKIPLFDGQVMPFQIGSYIHTVFLRLLILYTDNCGEGSEKATKEFFLGLELREQENCLGDVR